MKLDDVKEKIENYFDNVSSEEIIQICEEIGIELEEEEKEIKDMTEIPSKILNTRYTI